MSLQPKGEQNKMHLEVTVFTTINSVAVGNPSASLNQPSHRNNLQRINKLDLLEIDSHLLLRLLLEAVEHRARGALLKYA